MIQKYKKTTQKEHSGQTPVENSPSSNKRGCDSSIEVTSSEFILSEKLVGYYQEAMSKYGLRCFWNAKPSKTIHGLHVVMDRLNTYGDLAAWKLAAKIKMEIDNASR